MDSRSYRNLIVGWFEQTTIVEIFQRRKRRKKREREKREKSIDISARVSPPWNTRWKIGANCPFDLHNQAHRVYSMLTRNWHGNHFVVLTETMGSTLVGKNLFFNWRLRVIVSLVSNLPDQLAGLDQDCRKIIWIITYNFLCNYFFSIYIIYVYIYIYWIYSVNNLFTII